MSEISEGGPTITLADCTFSSPLAASEDCTTTVTSGDLDPITTTTTGTTVAVSDPQLPVTGTDVMIFAVFGMALILAGAVAVVRSHALKAKAEAAAVRENLERSLRKTHDDFLRATGGPIPTSDMSFFDWRYFELQPGDEWD